MIPAQRYGGRYNERPEQEPPASGLTVLKLFICRQDCDLADENRMLKTVNNFVAV